MLKMTTYINFPRARRWVRRDSIFEYIQFVFRTSVHSSSFLRTLARSFWAPSCFKRLPNELASIDDDAKKHSFDPSWYCFPTNGTRIQVFDVRNGLVLKTLKASLPPQLIEKEIESRSKTGDISPEILNVSTAGTAYVEKWLLDYRHPKDLREASIAISNLANKCGPVELLDHDDYWKLLEAQGTLTPRTKESVALVLDRQHQAQIPVRLAHGDVSLPNILIKYVDGTATIKLIDWEYSRKCVVSYDAWLLPYDYFRRPFYRQSNSVRLHSLDERYFDFLRQSLRLTELDNVLPCASVCHVLNLVERHSFLTRLSETSGINCDAVLRIMEFDLRRANKAIAI